MSDSTYARAKALFLAALALPPEDRGAFLAAEAGDDDGVASDVESLLAFHEDNPDLTPDAPAVVPLAPGSLYADRYRIVAPLGRGGMGEVYQALDERVGETIAVKRLIGGAGALADELLRNEVRQARRVTHPSVCRVYDLGEWKGERFITMEFVSGEDLARLLRRIGRLPSEKVTEISRELCIGLAAAHARGVFHRDLKPANVLIDDAGRVRITDFGIAVDRSEAATWVERAGTPAYMAPEQLVPGGRSTARSDIYALGLVMYEMLTGQPAFAGSGKTEVAQLRARGEIPSPSSVIPDVDPELERVVRHTLSPNPDDRPATALEVAAALPGGDALSAALEADLTPSPEMIAEAPTRGRSNPTLRSGGWFVGLVVSLIVLVSISDRFGDAPGDGGDVRPAVRADRAAATLRSIGVPAPGGDPQTFSGFLPDPVDVTPAGARWFWFREDGDRYRTTFQQYVLDPARNLLRYDENPPPEPGTNVVMFDEHNHLRYLEIGCAAPESAAAGPVDWDPVLQLAGLNPAELKRVDPERPATWVDERAAWTTDPIDPARAVRVEAAALGGRPVYFAIAPNEANTLSSLEARLSRFSRLEFVSAPVLFGILIAAFIIAWRNLRARRVDSKGTRRLVFVLLVMGVIRYGLLFGHLSHPMHSHAYILVQRLVDIGLNTIMIAATYLAFEPGVRRYWPHSLIAWARVVRGSVRNTSVGRALVVGSTCGVLLAIVYLLDRALPALLGLEATSWIDQSQRDLAALGISHTVAVLIHSATDAIGQGGLALLLLTLFRTWTRRPLIAGIAFVLVVALLETLVGGHVRFSYVTLGIPAGLLYLWIFTRVGLLTFVVTGFVSTALRSVPLTTDAGAWWAPGGWLTVMLVGLIGLAGLAISHGGRRAVQASGS